MHGHLFEFFGIDFPSYFVLIMLGFVFATAMGAIWARRVGQNPDVIVDLGLAMLIAGVAGARLLHVVADGFFWDYVHLCTDPSLVEWKISQAECLEQLPASSCAWLDGPGGQRGIWDAAAQVCRPPGRDCFAWAKFWAGGLTFYGGFLGATLGAWFLFKRDRFPFWKGVDMGGMMVPIGLGFGRLGCLMAGCCFGKPSELPWAVRFPGFSPASEWQADHGHLASRQMASLEIHPTQIYESAAAFAIAAFLILYLHGRKKYDGQVFVVFLGSYAVVRFILEFFRSDNRGGLWGLSTSQLIGILVLAAALALHRWRSGQPRLPGAGAPAAP